MCAVKYLCYFMYGTFLKTAVLWDMTCSLQVQGQIFWRNLFQCTKDGGSNF